MLDKVSTSSSARVSVARSASASPGSGSARAHEVAPTEAGHATQDDRPRWQEAGSDRESPEQENGSGAAARQAIDEALKALLPEAAPRARDSGDRMGAESGDVTEKRGGVASPPQAAASPHSRAVGAYGLQSALQSGGHVLRPGTVFSKQF